MTITKAIMFATGVLTILKLTGDITLSWWIVTMGLWVPLVVISSFLFVVMSVAYWVELDKIENKSKSKNKRK